MNEQNISISINTSADLSGAEKATAAIKQITRIEDIQNQTDKVHIGRWAFYDLDAQLVRTANTSDQVVGPALNRLSSRTSAASAASKGMGQLANQTSFQLQDFAVQVGSGTSAITAFSQQAPQLIGALQMAGVVTGGAALALAGIGVAIPVVTLLGKQLVGMFGETAEEAEKAAEKTAKLAEGAKKIEHDKLDDLKQAIDFAVDSEIALTEEFKLTQAASDAFAKSALNDAEIIASAQDMITVLLGKQIDKYKQIEEAERRASDRRFAEAQQALDAKQRELDDAQKKVDNAEKRYDKIIEDRENRLERLRKNLSVLQQDRADLAKATAIANAPVSDNYGSWSPAPTQGSFAKAESQKVVSDPQITSRIIANEKAVQKLQTELEAQVKAGGEIDRAALVVAKSRKDMEDLADSIKTDTERILNSESAANLKANVQKITDQSKQVTTDIVDYLSKLTPLSERAMADVAEIKKKTDDHILTIDELPKVNAKLGDLYRSIQDGFATSSLTTSEMQKWMNEKNRELSKLHQDMLSLKQQNSFR